MATQTIHLKNKKTRSWRERLTNIQTLRRLSQVGFALFILYTAVVHSLVGESGDVITASPEAFCPFGGFETAYRYFTSDGRTIQHTHLSNLVVFAALLVMTVFTRGAFCGWVCPFGSIQEWIHRGSLRLQKKIPTFGKTMRTLRTKVGVRPFKPLGGQAQPTLIERVDHYARYFRYVVLGWIVWGTITYGYMVFRDVDPYSALLSLGEMSLTLGTLVLVVVLLGSVFVERPWCRYACPLGAVVGVVSQVSPVRLQREGAACNGCNLCTKKCPIGIDVAAATDITSTNCTMCLECVDNCPVSGALGVKLVLPGIKATSAQPTVTPAAK